jgi:hypothetical protein
MTDMRLESASTDSVELLEPAPGKAPEALNGVDVARTSGELISSIGVVICDQRR